MESSLVIKVQYGNTLRRFNARVNEIGNLDLDLVGLTSKISSLFAFPPDVELTLTYTDEDGDIVTLADDNDLSDVTKQRLKFLKIFVSLKDDRSPGSYARSSGSSTPLQSPRVQQQLPNINAVVFEAVKAVPEPLREALSKLYQDLVSKAATSTPNIADAVEQLTRVGQSILNPAPANVSTGSAQTPVTSVDPSSKKTKAEAIPSATTINGAPAVQPSGSSEKCEAEATVTEAQIPYLNAGNEAQKNKKKESTSEAAPVVTFPSPSVVPDIGNQCPFSKAALVNEFAAPDSGHCPKPVHNHPVATGSIFHRGIQCDGCGVYPAVGDRYKSLVKEDFDLCSVCFNVMGKDADYIRLEKPVVSHRDMFPSQQHPWHSMPSPHGGRHRHSGVKRGVPKLDSCFMSDVTIEDGTIMAPSTPFIKIWRMRNNGNFIWSQGIRLVWIGGDRFDEKDSVEIEVPSEGIAVDAELNIAVDFTAPSAPGRYLSYWRMASPSGQKFGQRVWLLIHVDAGIADSLPNEIEGLNLNLPPPVNAVGSSWSSANVVPVEQVVVKEEEEHNFATNDELLVGNGGASVVYPVVDTSDGVEEEALLLKELEEMGFKEIDVNKQVLRRNGYNMDLTVEELCGLAEWDPILEELGEMGFSDKEMNKKLLKKNDGSIKRVVMDLLTGERP